MARRKRKDDEPDWVPPEFDEVGYMRTEIESARVAVITIGWALLGALISFLLYSVHPALAFVGGIGVAFGLYFLLPMLGISILRFKRRDWIGHGVTYFFSWLALWILLLNPPFGDFTLPTIHGISAAGFPGFQGRLTCVEPVGGRIDLRDTMGSNNSVYVLFRATDNVGLSRLNVTIESGTSGRSPLVPTLVSGQENLCRGSEGRVYPGGTYNVTFVATASTHTVTVTAADASGHPVSAAFVIVPQ